MATEDYRPPADEFERFHAHMTARGGVVQNGWRWMCPCPVPGHGKGDGDNRPSLSYWKGDDGLLAVHCFAGCDWRDIFEAGGIKVGQWADEPAKPFRTRDVVLPAPKPPKPRRRYDGLAAVIRAYEQWKGGTCSAFWFWSDGFGRTTAATIRLDAPDGSGKQGIFPASKVARLDEPGRFGEWEMRAPHAPRALYRVEDVRAHPSACVVVVEGEKTCEFAVSILGASTAAGKAGPCVVVTSWGGCHGPYKTDWSPLNGRQVFICPDQDPAGEKYAAAVFDCCNAAGARSISVVGIGDLVPELRGVKGADFADIVEGGAS